MDLTALPLLFLLGALWMWLPRMPSYGSCIPAGQDIAQPLMKIRRAQWTEAGAIALKLFELGKDTPVNYLQGGSVRRVLPEALYGQEVFCG